MTEILESTPVPEDQTYRAVPSATFGMLVHRNQFIHFQVIDMDTEIVESGSLISVSSKLPKNAPEIRKDAEVPSQEQRIHLYLDAKERQAIDAGEIAELAPSITSLSYRDVSIANFWLARRLSLFGSRDQVAALKDEKDRLSER